MKRTKVVGWSDSEDMLGQGWTICEVYPALPCTDAPDSTLVRMEQVA